MRGVKKADNYSVELYLKKHEGLMLALNRVEPKKLNPTYCTEHLNILEEKYDEILKAEDAVMFRPFRDLLFYLCKLALLGKDE